MSLGRVATLNTGAKIPLVGFGTWQSAKDVVGQAVSVALKNGYRHIDGAFIYGNEVEVGKAIKESGIPRNELFITTKLWNNSHKEEEVIPALEKSLQNLGLDYVDLYLIHWPVAFKSGEALVARDADNKLIVQDTPFSETWRGMEAALKTGKTKAIGVSNFSIKNLDILLKTANVVPAVNQVELHPELPQEDLLEYCKAKGIHLTAYSPLGSTDSSLIKRQEITDIATKHNVSNAQVLISWGAQRGHSVIPKSVTESRIIANFNDFLLDEQDVKVLKALTEKGATHRYCDPATFWGINIFN